MVDQPLGQAGRQHKLAVCDGDEAVSQGMEPKIRPAGLADASIEMLDGFEMGALEIPCHFCKLKKRNDTCEKNLILM